MEVLLRLAGFAVAGAVLTAFLSQLVPPLVRNWRTMNYPRVEGVVTASEPTKTEGSRTYNWKLEYTYAINGKSYTGTRYAYSEPDWYYPEDIDRLTAAFPVGAKVPAAYNPEDPTDAALRPGLAGRLFESAALALLVCGIGCFFGWAALFAPWSDASDPPPPRRFDPDNPRHVERTHDGTLIRLPAAYVVHPLLAIFLVGCIVLLIARNRPTPPDPYPGWVGFLIAVAAPLFAVALFALRRFPMLALDSWHKRLIFRPGFPWRERRFAFRDVGTVGVTTRDEKTKSGTVTYYQVRLYYTRSRLREVVMCEYQNSDDAHALVAWLRERLSEGTKSPA
jgi:hypothetical protein